MIPVKSAIALALFGTPVPFHPGMALDVQAALPFTPPLFHVDAFAEYGAPIVIAAKNKISRFNIVVNFMKASPLDLEKHKLTNLALNTLHATNTPTLRSN